MADKDEAPRSGGSVQLATVLAGIAALMSGVAAATAWHAARSPATAVVAAGPDRAEADAGSSCDQEMRGRARELFEAGRYDEAIQVLSALGPDDPDVQRLRARAAEETRARILWEEACREESGSGLRTTLCRRIDEDSSYHLRTCCAEPPRGGPAERPDTSGDAGAEGPDGDWFSAGSPANAEEPPEPPPLGERRPAAEALAEAQECVITNDQACCIRALANAERTSRVVNLLINCYHRAGRTDAACRLARRYPRSPNARQFREARCR
jgi:hypothetical protein